MRAILEAVSLAVLLFILGITTFALYGAHRLPAHIPIHLDQFGHPDVWRTPSSFAILPLLALMTYLIFSLAGAYSSMARIPADAGPEQGPAMEALILSLITWIKAELVAVFGWMQYSELYSARHPEEESSMLGVWILAGATFCTIAWHVTAMVRARRAFSESVDPEAGLPQP